MSDEYWDRDAAGEPARRPLPSPFPLCHTYVNHRYKLIVIINPKRCAPAWVLAVGQLRCCGCKGRVAGRLLG
jgi:hypothetical protein